MHCSWRINDTVVLKKKIFEHYFDTHDTYLKPNKFYLSEAEFFNFV
jgi:hypothetical protein